MPNHLHLFLRTPQPNLSRGMQYLLSGYANWYAKRHQRAGHLFQGRFKGELIEDESYFWTVSRYIHLNPVRGRRPLAAHPREWQWSSYPGYAQRRKRLDWVAYDQLYRAWQGEMDGSDAAASYRRFVEEGLKERLKEPSESPFRDAAFGWLLGSQEFIDQLRDRMKQQKHEDEVPTVRRLSNLDAATVIAAVADYYGVSLESYRHRRSNDPGRDLAAWLSRTMTTATLRDLMKPFGLTHPDSVSNLVRRCNKALAKSKQLAKDSNTIKKRLLKTVNRV